MSSRSLNTSYGRYDSESAGACTATLTYKDEARVYECIERGKNHTRHVFDLGQGKRREFEIKAVGGSIVQYVRWLEL